MDLMVYIFIVFNKWRLRYFLFIFTVVLGRLGAISRIDWIGVWLGLEVNLFRILPLILGRGSSGEAESCVKYFVIQVIGSGLIFFGAILRIRYWGYFVVRGCLIEEMALWIISIGLIIKIGLVPFHFWLPRVISNISWEACFGLSVWQKIAPLVILVGLVDGYLVLGMVIVGCLSRIIGGFGGLRQTCVRVLLGYSRIRHRGWLIVGGIYRIRGMFIYFFFYVLINVGLFYYLCIIETRSYFSILKGFRVIGVGELQVLRLFLVSLAGLPPTIGFTIKWCVFAPICVRRFMICGFLVLGSLLGVYFYSCLGFCWYVFSFSKGWDYKFNSKLGLIKGFIVGTIIIGGFARFIMVRVFCF